MRWIARGLLVVLGLPKTVAFNFRYLPLHQAILLPVLVSHRVAIFNFGGTVTLRGPAHPASVLLGFGANGAFDFRRERSVWQVAGDVCFDGPARLGHGFKLSLAAGARVVFGEGFVLSAESQIVSRRSITFGRDCLVSWDVLILDSDFHPVVDAAGRESVREAPIVLGDRVWVGARAIILKGVTLGDDVIVGAGAVVTRSEEGHEILLAGNPARVTRTGVRWRRS